MVPGDCYMVQTTAGAFFEQRYSDWCIVPWSKSSLFVPCPPSVQCLETAGPPLIHIQNALVHSCSKSKKYVCIKTNSQKMFVRMDRVPRYCAVNNRMNLGCLLVTKGGVYGNAAFASLSSSGLKKRKRKAPPSSFHNHAPKRSPVFCLNNQHVQLCLSNGGSFGLLTDQTHTKPKFCGFPIRCGDLDRSVPIPSVKEVSQHATFCKTPKQNTKFWSEALRCLVVAEGRAQRSSTNNFVRILADPSLSVSRGPGIIHAFLKEYALFMERSVQPRTPHRPLNPPPQPRFVCPTLYTWMARNPRTADPLSRMLGFASFDQHVDRLIRDGILNLSLQTLTNYLESFLEKIVVPLFGDEDRCRGLRDSICRSTVATTLAENKVENIVSELGRLVFLSKSDIQHVNQILQGREMKGLKSVLNLKQPGWIDVTYRWRPDDPLPDIDITPSVRAKRLSVLWNGCTPIPTPETIRKEEYLNLDRLKEIQTLLCQRLAEARAKGINVTQIDKYKSDIMFLDACLTKATRIENTGMGVRTIVYRKKKRIGRFIPTWPSFVFSPSRLRRFSCTHHTDVDIKNCHPTILSQLLQREKNTASETALEHYVHNRDAVLQSLSEYYGGCGRGSAKDLVLRLINGGGMAKWIDDMDDVALKNKLKTRQQEHPLVVRLLKETEYARKMLIRLYYGPSADVENTKLFSMCLQELECVCILAVDEYFERYLHIKVDSLVYDGAIVRSTNVTKEQIRGCEDHVFKRTSFRVVLTTKPFPVVEF